MEIHVEISSIPSVFIVHIFFRDFIVYTYWQLMTSLLGRVYNI